MCEVRGYSDPQNRYNNSTTLLWLQIGRAQWTMHIWSLNTSCRPAFWLSESASASLLPCLNQKLWTEMYLRCIVTVLWLVPWCSKISVIPSFITLFLVIRCLFWTSGTLIEISQSTSRGIRGAKFHALGGNKEALPVTSQQGHCSTHCMQIDCNIFRSSAINATSIKCIKS